MLSFLFWFDLNNLEKILIKNLQSFLNDYDKPPLDALTYLTAECNYGGRVTDSHDRRLLNSLLKTYYCYDIINNDNYKFNSLDEYFAPNDLSYDSYVEYIRNLPPIASPEVFGLHKNAKITRDNQDTKQLFSGILLTLPREVNSLK
jgi:dynein heavy chain